MPRHPNQIPGMTSENASEVRRNARRNGPIAEHWRPQTRADCGRFGRPCPYLGCRYNLSLSVSAGGGLRWQTFLPEDVTNCALDVAERGPHTLDEIGDLLGLGREWARNGLLSGLKALRASIDAEEREHG